MIKKVFALVFALALALSACVRSASTPPPATEPPVVPVIAEGNMYRALERDHVSSISLDWDAAKETLTVFMHNDTTGEDIKVSSPKGLEFVALKVQDGITVQDPVRSVSIDMGYWVGDDKAQNYSPLKDLELSFGIAVHDLPVHMDIQGSGTAYAVMGNWDGPTFNDNERKFRLFILEDHVLTSRDAEIVRLNSQVTDWRFEKGILIGARPLENGEHKEITADSYWQAVSYQDWFLPDPNNPSMRIPGVLCTILMQGFDYFGASEDILAQVQSTCGVSPKPDDYSLFRMGQDWSHTFTGETAHIYSFDQNLMPPEIDLTRAVTICQPKVSLPELGVDATLESIGEWVDESDFVHQSGMGLGVMDNFGIWVPLGGYILITTDSRDQPLQNYTLYQVCPNG